MQASDIAAVIVCDSVRREISGKELLIGVYTGNILTSSFPVVVELAFWFETDVKEKGEQDADIRIVVPGEVAPLEIRFHIDTVVPGPSSLATPQMQVPFLESGELRIELKEGDDWKILKRKFVELGKVPSQFEARSLESTRPSHS